jgi:hypothetical protein
MMKVVYLLQGSNVTTLQTVTWEFEQDNFIAIWKHVRWVRNNTTCRYSQAYNNYVINKQFWL